MSRTVRKRLITLLNDERIRFLIVGGINAAIGYGLFVAVELAFGKVIGYLGSLYISYVISVIISFVLHRRITFRAHRTGGSILIDFLRFSSVYLVSLAFNTVALPLLVELGHLPPIGAQAILVVVTPVITYLGHKYFSFARRSSAAPIPAASMDPTGSGHVPEATKSVPSPPTATDGSSAT